MTSPNQHTVVHTSAAPAAIGPYSQAIVAPGGVIFASGQIPIDPLTGNIVQGGIKEQTDRVLRNLTAVLQAGGSDLSRVVKTTVFLASMDEFTAMNEVYATFFPDTPPARSTVQVARLPRDVRIEIEAVALSRKG
ncbi:MAG: RidA family protein [Bacteroidota bacterium]